jgi:hypothetical protein
MASRALDPVMVGRLLLVSVGATNFTTEIDFISSLLPRFRYIAIDTE